MQYATTPSISDSLQVISPSYFIPTQMSDWPNIHLLRLIKILLQASFSMCLFQVVVLSAYRYLYFWNEFLRIKKVGIALVDYVYSDDNNGITIWSGWKQNRAAFLLNSSNTTRLKIAVLMDIFQPFDIWIWLLDFQLL